MGQELIEQPPQLGGCVHQALAEHPPHRLAKAREQVLPPWRRKPPAPDLPSQVEHRPAEGGGFRFNREFRPCGPGRGRGGLRRSSPFFSLRRGVWGGGHKRLWKTWDAPTQQENCGLSPAPGLGYLDELGGHQAFEGAAGLGHRYPRPGRQESQGKGYLSGGGGGEGQDPEHLRAGSGELLEDGGPNEKRPAVGMTTRRSITPQCGGPLSCVVIMVELRAAANRLVIIPIIPI